MLPAQLAPFLGGKLPHAAPQILCQGSVHGFQAAWLCAMPVFPLRSRNGMRNLLAVSLEGTGDGLGPGSWGSAQRARSSLTQFPAGQAIAAKSVRLKITGRVRPDESQPLANPVPHRFTFYPVIAGLCPGPDCQGGRHVLPALPDLLWKSPVAVGPSGPGLSSELRAGEEGRLFTPHASQSPGPSELLPSC